jgi:hypothetical protein
MPVSRAALSNFAMAAFVSGVFAANVTFAQTDASDFRFRDVGTETGFLPAAAQLQGHGAGWGDVDGDGWADIYIGTFHYRDTRPNLLFRNREGRFELDRQTQLRISTRATGILFADLDNDSDLDLYVASMPAPDGSKLATRMGHPFRGCSLFRNDGSGRFEDVSKDNVACPTEFGGRSVTVLDIDGDGLLDLLVGEEPVTGYNGSQTKTSRLFRNRGELQFEDVTQSVGIPSDAAGLGVAAADLNADGWPDFFLCSTIGRYLMLNDGTGKFRETPGASETFDWPTAKGDDMVCGVAIGDVNGDALPDIVLGQHFGAPWIKPLANRLYLHRGVVDGVPKFEDVTESAGLIPLPLKGPHVEIQDFDNDGRPDIYTSIVTFADGRPHPVIFRNKGNHDGIPQFEQLALAQIDFPTDEDRALKSSGRFFAKMVDDRKIVYSAPGPTCDFDRDGRLDMVLPNWWSELPSLLLKNETASGHWLDVRVTGGNGLNTMGIGARVDLYEPGHAGEALARIGSREIATGFGYASSQEAVAHFGLGNRTECDIVVTLPHGQGQLVRKSVKADQRLTLSQ